MVCEMKFTKMTIYNADNTEDVFLSDYYKELASEVGGITAIGYQMKLKDGSTIICQPSIIKRLKIEQIDA